MVMAFLFHIDKDFIQWKKYSLRINRLEMTGINPSNILKVGQYKITIKWAKE
jgi:hypothetical protein